MAKQESRPVKASEDLPFPIPEVQTGPCCILRLIPGGFTMVGGKYDSKKAALKSLQDAKASGDFVLLEVTSL